jgi:putative phosphoesterase
VLVGLISDTHIPEAAPDLWPQVYARLAAADLILHAGDVHTLETVDRLGELAPIYVARGNGDDGGAGRPLMPDDDRLREAWALEIGGLRVGLTHDVALPENPPHRTIHTMMEHHFGGAQQIVVHGHTHVASIETLRGVLLVNPGSPTYPRNLSTRLGTLGFLEIVDGGVRAWLEQLDAEGSSVVREQPRYV